MRVRSVVVASFAVTVAVACFGSAPPPPPDRDPFVGTWQANREKSRPRLDRLDVLDQRTIAREGDDLLGNGAGSNQVNLGREM
jgi:hypothetical protein